MQVDSKVQSGSYLVLAAKWSGALALSFWIAIPPTFKILVVLMGIDMVSGVILAFIKQSIDSTAMFNGLARKVLTILLIAAAHFISVLMNLGFDLGVAVALAYCINEGVSITENCAAAGIPIPTSLLEALGKIKYFRHTAGSVEELLTEAAGPMPVTTTTTVTETKVAPDAPRILQP